MDNAEYSDPSCCFDASQYIGHPDSEPCASAVNVPEVVKELDRLQNSGQLSEAQLLLEHWGRYLPSGRRLAKRAFAAK